MSSRGSFAELATFIRNHEVGRRAFVETPFGRRLLTYADLTATGRYLHFVEAWMRRVRPYYANTHTAVSTTGRIMSELREHAREVVRRGVNGKPDDVVLFVGSGATAAINKLVGLLGLRIPEPLERQYGLSRHVPERERPVVFVGPYEHHSNELPWMETIADRVEIEMDASGHPDLEMLERRLVAFADRPLKIGSFSAASNVTGILSDVGRIAKVLHRHGALAFFDYAASAPYAPIDMHPADPEARLDAVFLSPHKFMGGPQASGVLVAHRDLFRTRVPERPGGGTVHYVAAFDPGSVDYTRDLTEREEGGTPGILGDVRAGTAFLVKEMLGPERILEHEIDIARRAIERLRRHPGIEVLGPLDGPRLAILSFTIKRLHHDLVSALLDHLFGIQNRAGCSCAGPYGHRLLGVSPDVSQRFRTLVARGIEGIKPGWVRVSLPYYASDADLDFILGAIEFVADHGREFVPAYRLCWRTGVWHHVEHDVKCPAPIELTVEALTEAAQSFAAGDHEAPLGEAQLACERQRYVDEARSTAETLARRWKDTPPRWNVPTGDADLDEMVWFDYVESDAPIGAR